MELPGYRLISRLGERTWRARRLSDQALVAAKFLAGADAAGLRRRAGRQKALDVGASRRDPSGVVRAEAVEEMAGGAAVVTPFVEGEPLSRALERGVRMEFDRAVLLARAVAEALAAGADAGMGHGALHPARVVVRGEEAFVLALGTGEDLGGPRADGPHVYAAPEVLSEKPSDCRADIYSLGAVLFHMLTGHPPFAQGSVGALKLAKTCELRWPRGSDESIPARVMRLVERMMAPEADGRHGDYDELLVGFEAAMMKRKRRSRRRAALDEEEEEPRSWLRAALIAAAMVILAAAVGLRALLPSRGAREKVAEAPAAVSAQPARPTAEEDERAARRELGACAGAFDADPESAELLIPRLERLVGRKDDIGVDAELLLARLRRRTGREEPPEPEIAQKPEPAPAERTAAREEPADARRRLNAAAEVPLELAKLDPARARRLFEEAIAGLDIREHEEEVERIRAVLSLAEEALAEEERRQKEEKRRERLREEIPSVVARAGHLAGAFRYAEAAAALKGFLDENPPAEDADFLRDYAGLIEREAKLFREVGRRYETGAEEGGLLFTENGEFLRIVGLGGEGITLTSDELSRQGLTEIRMPWMHISSTATFDLFEEATDATRADERLALAVFAFHRGLAIECENGLTVASDRDPGFAPSIQRARAVLDRAAKLRSPRRARNE